MLIFLQMSFWVWSSVKACLMSIPKCGPAFERVIWGGWGTYGGLGLGPGPPNHPPLLGQGRRRILPECMVRNRAQWFLARQGSWTKGKTSQWQWLLCPMSELISSHPSPCFCFSQVSVILSPSESFQLNQMELELPLQNQNHPTQEKLIKYQIKCNFQTRTPAFKRASISQTKQ